MGIPAGGAWALEYTEQREGGVCLPGAWRARKGQELGGQWGKVAAAPRGSPRLGGLGAGQGAVGNPVGDLSLASFLHCSYLPLAASDLGWV